MPDESRLETLLGRGGWRAEVEVRRRELAHRLELASVEPAVQPSRETQQEQVEVDGATTRVTVTLEERVAQGGATHPAVRASHIEAAEEALSDAKAAVDSDPSVVAWVTGSAVTLAWESVHEAGAELVEIESDDSVRSSLPRLLDWIQDVMDKAPLRERYEKQLTAIIEGNGPVNRTLVRQAHQDVLTANNERHASLRTFRNLLSLATIVLTALLLVLAIWHAINPNFVSMCGGSSAQRSGQVQRCFSGDHSARRDIVAIELVGAIAGLLSVAFALGSEKTPPSRYNVRVAQTLLKPAAGAATAVIGVLLVQSGIVVSPAQSASESLFLAYAAVFGFSQQLLTQFVDKRAGKLLGSADEPAQK
jgi:hypothetical protein